MWVTIFYRFPFWQSFLTSTLNRKHTFLDEDGYCLFKIPFKDASFFNHASKLRWIVPLDSCLIFLAFGFFSAFPFLDALFLSCPTVALTIMASSSFSCFTQHVARRRFVFHVCGKLDWHKLFWHYSQIANDVKWGGEWDKPISECHAAWCDFEPDQSEQAMTIYRKWSDPTFDFHMIQ